MLHNVFTCDMVNRTEHALRNHVEGFRSRKVVLEDRTAFKTDCEKKEEWSYVNFFEFKNEEVLHLRQTLSRQHPIRSTGWIENIFAENDMKVLRSKPNMLYFLKAGKRSITYWDELSKE
ncbi:hypothetical protein DUI87_08476 [Hirundo rustica rustica]|uniref:Uncharacterized protein n=1 Tax=Hirundo rustica rustica TaxID=333673 RepID=A0A3M0KUA7_HIRRU|nr:hypothetical protein DUI87_08476 [Hirundo rustica rustica]